MSVPVDDRYSEGYKTNGMHLRNSVEGYCTRRTCHVLGKSRRLEESERADRIKDVVRASVRPRKMMEIM